MIIATIIFTFLATQFFNKWYLIKYKKHFDLFEILKR